MKNFAFTPNFSTRVYLSFLIVFVTTIFGLGIALWLIAGEQATHRAQREMELSLQGAEFNLAQEESDLTTLGKWLVDQKDFIGLVHSQDSNGLARMLEPLIPLGVVDVISVINPSGQVIVRVRENKPITLGDDLINQIGIKEALSGQSTYGLEPDEDKQLRGRFTLPIYDDANPTPIGVLVVGFYLDGSFFQRMSSGVTNQAMVIWDDRVAITNLAVDTSGTWIGQKIPEPVLLAEREGGPSEIVPLENEGGQYLFKFRPLHFPASVPAGMYGVGIEADKVEGERIELFRALGGWILVLSAAVSVLAFALAQALAKPILKLQSAARDLANGNLTPSVTLVRSDELGDLANQLETIRECLRTALQPARVEIKPIVCGAIMLNASRHQVTVSGIPVTLSSTEFKLLQYMMTNHDIVLNTSQIIANVWGYDADEDDNIVRMTISRLRKKIERNPSPPKIIVTIPGVGYMLQTKS